MGYKIKVDLITEAIFGSGHSIPSSVDLEIVCDDYGLPYMKAKTFKGNFREAMEDIVKLIGEEKYKKTLYGLLGVGKSGVNQWKTLKFSDMRLSEGIRNYVREAVIAGKINSTEIKEALTDVRSFTSVDEDGSLKKGSLRQMRVISKDLMFEVELYVERELSTEELGLISMTSRYLRHIGTMRTRGKGEIECSFLQKHGNEFIDITEKYIDEFVKAVKIDA